MLCVIDKQLLRSSKIGIEKIGKKINAEEDVLVELKKHQNDAAASVFENEDSLLGVSNVSENSNHVVCCDSFDYYKVAAGNTSQVFAISK